MPEVAPSALTQVELVNHEGRIERSLRFGRSSAERSMGGSRRIVSFAAGAVFCLVDQRAVRGRSAEHRVAVLRAVAQGEAFTTYPDVAPGAEILLALRGWTRVQAVLEAVDDVERLGVAPERAAPDYWRHVGARVGVSLPPRAYELARHRAWQRRRDFFS